MLGGLELECADGVALAVEVVGLAVVYVDCFDVNDFACGALDVGKRFFMMESVFSPRKSILISPVSSITFPSYCVTMVFSLESELLSTAVLTYTQSVMSSRHIMTPQACTPVLRTVPSSSRA